MLSFLASYSLKTCFTTNSESLKAKRFQAWRIMTNRSPAIIASYFALLLVALKLNRSACLILNPYGIVGMIHAPLFSNVEDPLTKSIHPCGGSELGDVVSGFGDDSFPSSGKVHSVTKSANVWDFMAVWGKYSMLYWLISMDHASILLDMSS